MSVTPFCASAPAKAMSPVLSETERMAERMGMGRRAYLRAADAIKGAPLERRAAWRSRRRPSEGGSFAGHAWAEESSFGARFGDGLLLGHELHRKPRCPAGDGGATGRHPGGW